MVPCAGLVWGSSPHTRGAPVHIIHQEVGCRIIPAYAGSTPSRRRAAAVQTDHPRIRGEHVLINNGGSGTLGSSPHTRGAPGGLGHHGGEPGIIPAYAGSTLATIPVDYARTGSSPHTRGAPVGGDVGELDVGIIPAYAGSTPAGRCTRRAPSDHPRIRGEHSF